MTFSISQNIIHSIQQVLAWVKWTAGPALIKENITVFQGSLVILKASSVQ